MANPDVYIPGSTPRQTSLDRYLPPLPVGVVAAWLDANVPKGAWVLDPFGASPRVATEAARAGYRVAVAANNPIARFLLEIRALAPSADDFRAALAELAAARRGDERLETAILELYQTTCPKCGAQTPAETFIWEREAAAPHAKIVSCPACNGSGEYPADEQDRERAAAYPRGGPQLSRALERIAPKGDPDREHAEEALEAYLPRAVYALFTIINRVDGMTLDENQRRLVSALVLSACDRATSLWAHPSGRLRPKQLSAPVQFREYNIWHEMEGSIDLWAQNAEPLPLFPWPESPPERGGISLFEGRFRDMADDLTKINTLAVVTAFPRPNQAFWTLCALWAGWLWGREAIGPFALVLRRKRYDWGWHAEALHAGLAPLSEQLGADTPLFGIVGESEPGFNTAVITAANLSDFRLEGMALRREADQLQLLWRKGVPAATAAPAEPTETVRRAAVKLLAARGEPTHFQHLQLAGLSELSKRAQLGSALADASELQTETRGTFEVGLTFRGSFTRFGASEQSLETGLWWLLDPAAARSPLTDRVEVAVVGFLLRRPGHSLSAIATMRWGIFHGLLTPPLTLTEAILNSYGEQKEGLWSIAPGDQPKSRRKDLREMRATLDKLGTRLGHQVSGDSPVEWRDGEGKVVLAFYPIASALLGDILLKSKTPPEKSLVLLPGRRAALVLDKIERDPRFKQATEDGWRFMKFRHMRRLAENLSLTAESLSELLELDPLTLEQAQAPLL